MSSAVQVSIPDCGTVQGVQTDTQPTVAKFLNIPYATVPERWRPAVKAVPWTGVRDASVQGYITKKTLTGSISVAKGLSRPGAVSRFSLFS